MKNIMTILACTGLALTAIPSIFVFSGTFDLILHKQLMIVGTALWFLAAPLWIRRETKEK